MIRKLLSRTREYIPVRRLFLKFFLWFWFAIWGLHTIVVGSGYLAGTHPLTEPNLYATVAPILAAEAVRAYESGGPEAFSRFSQIPVHDKNRQLYLLDGYGADVLGRPVTDDGMRLARKVRAGEVLIFREQIAAYRFVSPNGHPYVFLLYLASGFYQLLGIVLARGVLFPLALVLLVTPFCLWLAYHIASPIHAIQAAARKVTRGDLSARAPARVLARHDELASLAADFNSMVARIALLLQTQKNLLAAVSHELRSPLARLNVSVALLHSGIAARGQNSPQQTDLLGRMERDIGTIDRLIGQLLTLSRFESGISGAPREAVDLSLLIEEVGADGLFEAQAGGKAVQVLLEDAPILQHADAYALRSACENIVRNAVRFTPPGTTVELELARETLAGRPCAVIAVRDRGPGIPEPMLQSIFDPFVRVGAENTPGNDPVSENVRGNALGNGLGLAIAAGAVHLHRGTIVARNRLGGGLEILIHLPLHEKGNGQQSDRDSRPATRASALAPRQG